MNLKNTAISALVALSGSSASADVYTWAANVAGSWADHSMWNGPTGQVPDSIADTATVSGGAARATFTAATSLANLNVFNGADVYTAHNSLFVSGNINVWGSDSSLSMISTPALRDLDVDTFSIKEGWYTIHESFTQIDESLTVDDNGVIAGSGTIEMNSNSGNLVVDHGTIWAQNNSDDGITLTRSDSSTSRLDWTDPNSNFVVWDAMTMRNELPYTGALGGRIAVVSSNGHSRFESVHPFVAGPNSEMEFGGNGNGWISYVTAPGIDVYGDVTVNETGAFDTNILALRGRIDFTGDHVLGLRSTTTIFDSVAAIANTPGASLTFWTGSENMTVTGGTSKVYLGNGGSFDLCGTPDFTTTIAEGSMLDIISEYLNTGNRQVTYGTVNVAGTLVVDSAGSGTQWENKGEVVFEGGEYFGRDIHNTGIVRGHGDVNGDFETEGEVIANGGTLAFEEFNPGGVIRAQTGDITTGVPSQVSLTTYFFTGDMFIGDGQGVREVYDSVDGMFFHDSFLDETGSLTMNEGRLVLANTRIAGDISIQGHSTITATRESSGAYIKFVREGTTVNVDGTLDLRGNVEIQAAPTFSGSGTIDAASISRTIDLARGVDLGELALDVAGTLTMGDNELSLVGQASAGSLQLGSVSRVRIDLGGPTPNVDHDQLNTSGDTNLDGELVLRRVNGFQPVPGVTFAVIKGGTVNGEFDSVDLTNVSDTYRVEIEYPGDRVNVTFFCKADINGDGVLNGADFNAFLMAFNADDMIADQNDDGVLNGADFNAWLTNFNIGCG